jgi:hypothetical protein
VRPTLLTSILVGLAGCGPRAAPSPTESGPPPPTIDTRQLDEGTDEELRAAWKNNPAAAKKHYADARFRFRAVVIEVSPSGATIYTYAGPASITFRDDAQLRRLVKRGEFEFVATVERYQYHLPDGLRYTDAVVVGGPLAD